MKNIWSIMCARSSVDATSNSLSLFDCLEEVTIEHDGNIKLEEIKTLPLNFEIVSLWFDENLEANRNFDLSIELTDPKNKSLNEFSKNCIIEKGKKRLRTIIKVSGFGVTLEGVYVFKVKYKEGGQKSYKTASEIPFEVNLVKRSQ